MYYIKTILSALLFILMHSLLQAQQGLVADSIVYYIRNAEEVNGLPPLSPDDPGYKEPEAELTMVIYLAEPANVKSLTIDMGHQKDGDNIRKWKYDLVQNEGKYLLKRAERSYAVRDNKIIITETVPASIYTEKMHLILKTTDSRGEEIRRSRKQFN